MADERRVSPVATTSADPDEAYRLFAPIRDQYIRDIRTAESRGRTAGYAEAVQAFRTYVEANFHPASGHGRLLRSVVSRLEKGAPTDG